uniref:Pentatricopeptide repeat-containing protein n=1 Tax=Tanacetum cinerariifolium TaxID=118510 RepID=A0A6L2MYI0_TANCI|nr:pentatricopeptide repeat-containing protein [Tanacetum cinerariifolium]
MAPSGSDALYFDVHHDGVFVLNPLSDSDSDSEYSDKSVDYLSEGDEELIELRKRKTEAKNAPKVRKQQTQAINEGTSSGVRQRKQYFVSNNETVIEHEGFMDVLLRMLSQDNGNGCDLFVDIEQLKGCVTYYALSNGYSLWLHIISKTKLIAKFRLRPETIKDPKLGKQSKFKRYPSEANRSKCRWRCYGKKMTTEIQSNSEKVQVHCNPNQNTANDSFAATQETHNFSATAFASTQNSQNHQVSEKEPQAAEQELQAAEQEPHRARPSGIVNFIKPRPRSERILKKQQAKKVHGIVQQAQMPLI